MPHTTSALVVAPSRSRSTGCAMPFGSPAIASARRDPLSSRGSSMRTAPSAARRCARRICSSSPGARYGTTSAGIPRLQDLECRVVAALADRHGRSRELRAQVAHLAQHHQVRLVGPCLQPPPGVVWQERPGDYAHTHAALAQPWKCIDRGWRSGSPTRPPPAETTTVASASSRTGAARRDAVTNPV